MSINNTKSLFAACVLGTGPTLIKSTVLMRKQGNGNFTGFVRKVYSDGVAADAVFIENARTPAAVLHAYSSQAGYQAVA